MKERQCWDVRSKRLFRTVEKLSEELAQSNLNAEDEAEV
jgi:hypothetical protein